MSLLIRVLSSVVAMGLFVCVAGAEPMSYQGSLQDNGQPANGLYDLEFRLYDSSATPVTAPVEMHDVEVIDGLFYVEINFPDGVFEAFDDLDLGVRVRDGGSVGGYTELLPRTSITPAPVAVRALSADNVEFTRVGDDLFLGSTDERILINPDHTAGVLLNSSTDLQLNFDRLGFGGMYINGGGNSSFPFYGFSMGENIAGYIYMYNPAGTPGLAFRVGTQNLFDLSVSGAQFVPSVEMDNNLKVWGNIEATDLGIEGDAAIVGDLKKEYNGVDKHIAPVAFGSVDFDGSVISGSGNFSVSWDSTFERYIIDVPGHSLHGSFYTMVVTPRTVDPVFTGTSSVGTDMLAYFHDISGNRIKSRFTFVIYDNN